jgi:hypothetical protein
MARRLKKLKILEVSACDRGAGEGTRILLMKRANKEADMDMVVVAKRVAAGEPTTLTKADSFIELQKRAEADRQPGETPERAFSRYSTTTTDGRALLAANLYGPGPDYCPPAPVTPPQPVTSAAYQKLMKRARKLAGREGITEASAFAKVYVDPANRALVLEDKAGVGVDITKAGEPPLGGKRAKLQRTVERMIDATVEGLISSGKAKDRSEAIRMARRMIVRDGRLAAATRGFA